MASLDSIQNLLDEIRVLLIQTKTERTAAHDVMVVSGLSDINEKLGLVQAGEFRAGNSKDPGHGFTGVRIGYPPFLYNAEYWNIAGVSNDVLEFGLNASNGKAYFAAGDAVIDENGITFLATASTNINNFVRWLSDDTSALTGYLSSWYATSGSPIETATGVFAVAKSSSHYASVFMAAASETDAIGAYRTQFKLDSRGITTLDLRDGTVTTKDTQALDIKGKSSTANDVTALLYLDAYTSGTAANGFGPAITFRAQTPAGTILTIGYIEIEYTDTTAGLEDSKVVAAYLVNGVLTEKVLAP